jgi:uncharacterized protein YodC (DUF2158 family)
MTANFKQNNKWIKPGDEVAHRDFPKRKMIAEEVIKQSRTFMVDGKEERHVLTIGVWCHWFDNNGRYDRGRFMTMELIPFGADPGKNPIDESFPKEIPSNELTTEELESLDNK